MRRLTFVNVALLVVPTAATALVPLGPPLLITVGLVAAVRSRRLAAGTSHGMGPDP